MHSRYIPIIRKKKLNYSIGSLEASWTQFKRNRSKQQRSSINCRKNISIPIVIRNEEISSKQKDIRRKEKEMDKEKEMEIKSKQTEKDKEKGKPKIKIILTPKKKQGKDQPKETKVRIQSLQSEKREKKFETFSKHHPNQIHTLRLSFNHFNHFDHSNRKTQISTPTSRTKHMNMTTMKNHKMEYDQIEDIIRRSYICLKL